MHHVTQFDPFTEHSGSTRKKKQTHNTRDKSIQTLYNKLHELVGLLSELLNIQVLTDTTVLHASSLGVAPFFVESVSELQLSALRLVTSVSVLSMFCIYHIFSWHQIHNTCTTFFVSDFYQV